LSRGSRFIREGLAKPTVFKDEAPLSIDYIPTKLPHREKQLRFLSQIFRSTLERPGSMGQKVLITGSVGVGKTILAQHFGLDLMKVARTRKIHMSYVHVNCRECRGSLFLVLKRILGALKASFPQRGYSSEELLEKLMDTLDRENIYLVLALDELESLIGSEGPTPIYNLTRIQETRFSAPIRLSLICILREPEFLHKLDPSTLSTLQQNLIQLEGYSSTHLKTILEDRVKLAFRDGAVSRETVEFVSDVASAKGDARYAIELLWRAGKYADVDVSSEVSPEHVRMAVGSIYPAFREDYVKALSLHEKLLLLGVSRALTHLDVAYATMGEVEKAYGVVCEEYGEKPRTHTQVWKYVKGLGTIGVLSTKKVGKGVRGKTTMIGLTSASAVATGKMLESSLEVFRRKLPRAG